MPDENLILFLDLETTGSDVNNDEVIEVGLVMLDAESLEEKATLSLVVFPGQRAFNRMMNNQIVHDMHVKSGLLDDLDNGIFAHDADQLINNWLNEQGAGTTHLPYGGSGVSHFDRKFIDKYLPAFGKRLTYWSYDVGVARRIARKAGLGWLNQDAKNHRALVDARFHAEEFRYAIRAFSGQASALRTR